MTFQAFEPIQLGKNLKLKNRIVMPAMARWKCKSDCVPHEGYLKYYKRRAKHNVGLIISEGTHVDNTHSYAIHTGYEGRLTNEKQKKAFEGIVKAVHKYGGNLFRNCGIVARMQQILLA